MKSELPATSYQPKQHQGQLQNHTRTTRRARITQNLELRTCEAGELRRALCIIPAVEAACAERQTFQLLSRCLGQEGVAAD